MKTPPPAIMKTKRTYFIPFYILLALGIQAAFFCPAIKAQDQGQSDRTFSLDCPPPTPAGIPVTFTAKIGSGISDLPVKWELSAGTITTGQGTPSITVDTTGLEGQTVSATLQIGEVGQSRSLSCSWPIVQPPSQAAQQVDSGSQSQNDNPATANAADNTEVTNQPENTTPPASTESTSQVSDQASAANAELQGQVNQLQDQLAQLQSQLSSATQGQADSLTSSDRTALQNQANQIQGQLEQLQGKLNTNIRGQTSGQVSEADTKLQSQVSQLQGQLSQLQGKLTASAQKPLDKVKLPGKLGKLASLGGKLQGTLDKVNTTVNTTATAKAQDQLNKVSAAVNTRAQSQLDKVTTVSAAVNTKVTDSMSRVQNQASKLQNPLNTATQPLASVEQQMQSLLITAKPDTKPYLELAQQDISTAQGMFAAGKLQQGTRQTKVAVQTLIETSKNGVDTTALQTSLVEGVEAHVNKAVAEKEASVGSDNPNAQKAREALNEGHALLEQGALTRALDAFLGALQQLSAPSAP